MTTTIWQEATRGGRLFSLLGHAALAIDRTSTERAARSAGDEDARGAFESGAMVVAGSCVWRIV